MIFITDVSNFLNNSLFDSALELLDEERVRKVNAIRPAMEKCRSLCGGLLIRYALGCFFIPDFLTRMSDNKMKEGDVVLADTGVTLDFTGLEGDDRAVRQRCMTVLTPEDLTFLWPCDIQIPNIVYKNEGKPVVHGCHDFHFSISHSGDLAGIYFGERECGFDLQEFCRISEGVFRRVLSPEEKMKYDEIISLHFGGAAEPFKDRDMDKTGDNPSNNNNVINGDNLVTGGITSYNEGEAAEKTGDKSIAIDSKDYFFRCWSAKESYLKLTGEGFRRELNTVSYDLDKSVISCEGKLAKCQNAVFAFKGKKYSISVCER